MTLQRLIVTENPLAFNLLGTNTKSKSSNKLPIYFTTQEIFNSPIFLRHSCPMLCITENFDVGNTLNNILMAFTIIFYGEAHNLPN